MYKTLKIRNNVNRIGEPIILVLRRRKTNPTKDIISEKLLRYYLDEECNLFNLYEKDKSSLDTSW